jgi:hypothetical protein
MQPPGRQATQVREGSTERDWKPEASVPGARGFAVAGCGTNLTISRVCSTAHVRSSSVYRLKGASPGRTHDKQHSAQPDRIERTLPLTSISHGRLALATLKRLHRVDSSTQSSTPTTPTNAIMTAVSGQISFVMSSYAASLPPPQDERG